MYPTLRAPYMDVDETDESPPERTLDSRDEGFEEFCRIHEADTRQSWE
jgi:hypothetical protein